ncbi:ribokinase [Roseinatronobacter sp.]|uniref:ribokinase n=1 Tax=Roseinatronobacter sp. TaxID=1945755 RepID=UPI0025D72C02|nr:ribokinase [Rhodobaca sp.]
MTVWCFGSINIDHFYSLEHLPAPGETLAASGYRVELGGKGANQSVAAARAGATVRHLGAIGADGDRALAGLIAQGVNCDSVQRIEGPTGHAVIMLDQYGENSIITEAGANRKMALEPVLAALEQADLADILLLQNETAFQPEIAEAAMGRGMEVIYSAAPFEIGAVRAVLPYVNTLVMNAVEAAQLRAALDVPFEDLPVEAVVITRGAEGASWHARGTPDIFVPALPTKVVDSTGAGDCFTGALAASFSMGAAPEDAMLFAAAAAAIQVSRPGTSAAMPLRAEIEKLVFTT